MESNTAERIERSTIEIAGHVFEIEPLPANFNREELILRYWRAHPRFQFFKTVPAKARFLDIGAGSGGLAYWKSWGTPDRADIRMFGVDLKVGEHSGLYEDFRAMNLDSDPLPFEDKFFDVIYASHLIEHVNHRKLFTEARRVAKAGALMYLETPTPESKTAPSRNVFIEKGYQAVTLNFYDDATHIDTLSLDYLKKTLPEFDFEPERSGIIRPIEIEGQLLSAGFQLNDPELLSFGLWSRFQFAEYVVARRN